MTLFLKIDRDFGTNVKLGRVGLVGVVVLLQLDAEHLADQNEGVVSAKRASPEQLQLRLAAFKLSEAAISAALQDLATVGIIQRLEDGAIRLLNWEEWSKRPLTNAEKCKSYRERQKQTTDTDRHRPTPGDGRDTPKSTQEQPRAEVPPTPNARPVDESSHGEPEFRKIMKVLEQGNFSSGTKRFEQAKELELQGMTGADAERLLRLAREQGDNPTRLFAHWLHKASWRRVLDQQQPKQEQIRPRSTHGREPEPAPVKSLLNSWASGLRAGVEQEAEAADG